MSTHNALQDPSSLRAAYARRTIVALLVVVVALGLILLRYYQLQVLDHKRYELQSERNRIQVRPIEPSRGLIYDRNGHVLAENRPSFALALIPEKIADIDTVIASVATRVDISEEQITQFKKRLRRTRSHDTAVLKSNLSDAEIARIVIDSHVLEGVVIEAEPLRYYPRREVFSHSVGYVGRLSERELEKVDPNNYANTNFIGKTGVERFYEDILHGQVGYENVEINARGRVLRVLERNPAIAGKDIQLHLDSQLQTVAYQALGNKRGAVVAIEIATGGVLTLVSTPGFNANLFVQGISNHDYQQLRQNKDLPLFNRAVLGQYPPGSTLKPIIGLAGLEYGVVKRDTKVKDPGWYQLPNDERFYRDWKKKGHGREVDLRVAIEQSCDVYYYELAYRLGIDRMHTFLSLFGLGVKTGIDLVGEKPGLIPSSVWKRRTKRQPWFPGETLIAGIGQGYMLATPLQLAVSTATLASNGRYIRPQLLKAVGGTPQFAPALNAFVLRDPSNWEYIRDAMIDVVHSNHGTAKVIAGGLHYTIAGKTGTAQVVGIAQDSEYDAAALLERHRDHALFVAFAPAEAPTIAVAVIVENGEHGSSVAAPVARAVLDAWMAK